MTTREPHRMTPSQLLAARKRLGLSQAGLAEALDYKDPVSISRMERGVSPISRVTEYAVKHLLSEETTPRRKRR